MKKEICFLDLINREPIVGDLKIIEHGDAVHVKIKIAAYPAKKGNSNGAGQGNFRCIIMFFDFHVHGDSKLVFEVLRLGYSGTAIIQSSKNYNSRNLMISKKLKVISKSSVALKYMQKILKI